MAQARLLQFLTLGGLCLVWGSTWLVIKVGLEGVPAFLGAALRFLLAAAILLGLATLRHLRLRPNRAEALLILFFGAVVFFADYGLLYWAEGYIPSGLTAVLFSTMPFLVLLFALPLLGERPTVLKVGGMTLGFLGILVIFRDYLGAVGPGVVVPMVAVVGSAICAGLGSVAVKRQGQTFPAIPFNGWAMTVGALLHLLLGRLVAEPLAAPSYPVGVLSILFLALLGSVFGFIGYFWLLQRMEATTLSLITLVFPVIALALGFGLGERVDVLEVVGAGLTLGGVALSTLGPRRAPGPAVAAAAPPASFDAAREPP